MCKNLLIQRVSFIQFVFGFFQTTATNEYEWHRLKKSSFISRKLIAEQQRTKTKIKKKGKKIFMAYWFYLCEHRVFGGEMHKKTTGYFCDIESQMTFDGHQLEWLFCAEILVVYKVWIVKRLAKNSVYYFLLFDYSHIWSYGLFGLNLLRFFSLYCYCCEHGVFGWISRFIGRKPLMHSHMKFVNENRKKIKKI